MDTCDSTYNRYLSVYLVRFIDNFPAGTRGPHQNLVEHDGGEVLGPLHGPQQLLPGDHRGRAPLAVRDLRDDLVHDLLRGVEALQVRGGDQVVQSVHQGQKLVFADIPILVNIKGTAEN